MAAGTLRHITVRGKGCRAFVWNHVRVAVRVAIVVAKIAERLLFKIAPAQFTIAGIREAWSGNPVNKLFRIIKVRAPGDIPTEGLATGAH